jgi:hypothetical protein
MDLYEDLQGWIPVQDYIRTREEEIFRELLVLDQHIQVDFVVAVEIEFLEVQVEEHHHQTWLHALYRIQATRRPFQVHTLYYLLTRNSFASPQIPTHEPVH